MSTLNKEKNLSKRIDVALAKKDYKKTFKDTDSLNIYYRVGTELLAGLLIGAGLGWTIDQWLNTTPLFLIIFFITSKLVKLLISSRLNLDKKNIKNIDIIRK